MVIKEEQERVRMLLSDTITLLCRNGLTFKSEFCISALIGITLDKEDVILVDIRETIKNYEDHEKLNDNNGNTKVKNKARKNRKKRRHSSSNSNSESSSDDGDSDEVEKKVKSETYLDKDEGSDDLVFVKTEPGLDDSSNSIISNQQTEFLGYSGSQSMLGNTSANHAQPMTSGFSPNLGYDPGSQLPFIPQLPPDGQQFAGSSQEAANGTNPPSMQPQMNTSQAAVDSDTGAEAMLQLPQPPTSQPDLAKKGQLYPKEEVVMMDDTTKGKMLKFSSQEDDQRKLALKCICELLQTRKQCKGDAINLVCKICKDKKFTAISSLMCHYRSHAGIKPFVCLICNATFTRRYSLDYHMLIHNNQSRFTCKDCGRKFRQPSHFKEHLRNHTGETPFHCTECFLRFKTRNSYKYHLRTRHGKLLTRTNGIKLLPPEEFLKVKRKFYSRRNSVNVEEKYEDDDIEDNLEDNDNDVGEDDEEEMMYVGSAGLTE